MVQEPSGAKPDDHRPLLTVSGLTAAPEDPKLQPTAGCGSYALCCSAEKLGSRAVCISRLCPARVIRVAVVHGFRRQDKMPPMGSYNAKCSEIVDTNCMGLWRAWIWNV